MLIDYTLNYDVCSFKVVDQRAEILEFTEKLLEAITTGDYETYKYAVLLVT